MRELVFSMASELLLRKESQNQRRDENIKPPSSGKPATVAFLLLRSKIESPKSLYLRPILNNTYLRT